IPLELFVSTLPLKPLAHAKTLKYSTKFMTKNLKPNGQLPNQKLTTRCKLDRRKICQITLFQRFQISKGFELRTLTAASEKLSFHPNISALKKPHQRNNPKVRHRKR
ncbi:hypothetical protein, partial [Vibrio parahaemolyticus]|uniref:hypothetical protein n=1 Tax=Vibrio parahaemolyticus TaxID=670 RepID=UPI001E49FA57